MTTTKNDECPCCYDKKGKENYLACRCGNFTCMKCIKKMLMVCDADTCSPHCSGVSWTCPMCREHCTLRNEQVIAVAHGSFKIWSDIQKRSRVNN